MDRKSQTFLSFVYRSSGVSSPLVRALTLGPSLIPEDTHTQAAEEPEKQTIYEQLLHWI